MIVKLSRHAQTKIFKLNTQVPIYRTVSSVRACTRASESSLPVRFGPITPPADDLWRGHVSRVLAASELLALAGVHGPARVASQSGLDPLLITS